MTQPDVSEPERSFYVSNFTQPRVTSWIDIGAFRTHCERLTVGHADAAVDVDVVNSEDVAELADVALAEREVVVAAEELRKVGLDLETVARRLPDGRLRDLPVHLVLP